MSALHSFPPSPAESNDGHSHFFAHSDDDADTASQRSISLSSGPPSPKPIHSNFPSPASLKTPMMTSFVHHLASSNISIDTSPSQKGPSPENQDTHSIPGTGSNGPLSVVTSFKFDEDSTRSSSMSSDTSLYNHEEASRKPEVVASPPVETTYPPPSQMIPAIHNREFESTFDRRATDVESLASGSSNGTGGRKTRPESMLMEPPDGPLVLGIALVDFNHVVGPRVEFFEGSVFDDEELVRILPFLALPDGAHLSSEDYSYFHLVPSGPKPTTIFGISCNRQIASADLLSRDEDVTRSMVQKAVVVLAIKPVFGAIRDKLGVVTTALFNQRDFHETSILVAFLATLETSLRSQLTESGLVMGTSLRELVHKFRHRTLVLLKALVLQKKIMFYGHPVERLCTYQYSLLSLIPCLLQSLEDCGSPPLAARAPTLSRPTSLRTSDRKSVLAFVGLPLDIFGKDAFFQPYLPLQQVDIAKETNSWLCGCTNSIVYTQSNYDLLVNIETNTFEFRDPKMERLVALTPADRKWMDDIIKDVNEEWNENDPSRPAGMQFKGSDDYLRTKFEEYVSAALATVKYTNFLAKGNSKGILISDGYGADTVSLQDFGAPWIAAFKLTQAFDTWERITDPMLFDIVEPRHPCVDKPSAVTDIGLQLSETIRDLKIDQQLAPTREAISSAFSTGSTNFFKAVDGIKGRWPAQRSSSTNSIRSNSSTSTGNANSVAEGSNNGVESEGASASAAATREGLAPPPPPPPGQDAKSRPPGIAAAQVTSDAKAAIGAWGTGIGSFFASKASRFSLSRQNGSSTPAPMRPPSSERKADSPSDVLGGVLEQPTHGMAEAQMSDDGIGVAA